MVEEVKGPMEIVDVAKYNIGSCCDFDYGCFKTDHCICMDDMELLKDQVKTAKEIYVTLPVFRGHLSSIYYKVHERLTGDYRIDDKKLCEDYLDKTTYFLMVNKNGGLEQALSELKSDIDAYGGKSRILIVSSRDFEESSIDGTLKDNKEYRNFIKTQL